MGDGDPLLSVRDLEVHYPIEEGILGRGTGRVRAVDGMSFDLHRGEILGLIGESGCGKSTTARSLFGLETLTDGTVRFDGTDVFPTDERVSRTYRRRVQLVLQDPDSAFDPRMSIGSIVGEPLRVHGVRDRDRRRRIAAEALERAGLGGADLDEYPHGYSGGEKQRIALARALVLDPDVVVADEPVSALDGRTKAEVLGLIRELRDEFGLSVLLISHDLDVVERYCDRLAVMYLGRIVERGESDRVVRDPAHPYTRALVDSIPRLSPDAAAGTAAPDLLTDELPDASDIPGGCRFHPRCPAIIPPPGVDLFREEWRRLAAFRRALDDDAAASRYVGKDVATLRDTFGLPERFTDADVDEAVHEAATALGHDDLKTARSRLDAVDRSVCRRDSPTLLGADTARDVACHRYDPDVPGDPETMRSDTRDEYDRE